MDGYTFYRNWVHLLQFDVSNYNVLKALKIQPKKFPKPSLIFRGIGREIICTYHIEEFCNKVQQLWNQVND